jgi:4-amino-4-deoxychorismate lyase
VSARVYVNGVEGAQIPVHDRGLMYGDGLFETILFVAGAAPLWLRHRSRLESGAAKLGFALPPIDAMYAIAQRACSGLERAAVRITITRGVGERGYAPPVPATPNWVVSASAAPVIPPDWYARGIRVRCCGLRLAAQPLLAGLKHLNRLEQVLARAEWDDANIVEGLLGDAAGHVISATAANLFVVRDGRLFTPALDECGVAGVSRAEVLARREVVVGSLTWNELMHADEVFLTSSLRGILPVRAIDAQPFTPGAVTHDLQREWRARGLMEPAHG